MSRQLPTGRRALEALCCALLLATGSLACGPDTEARWDEFLDESDPERQEAQDAAEQQASCDGDPCTNCDISGYHLVGLETLLGPDLPIQFMTQVTVNGDTADFSFQPLMPKLRPLAGGNRSSHMRSISSLDGGPGGAGCLQGLSACGSSVHRRPITRPRHTYLYIYI